MQLGQALVLQPVTATSSKPLPYCDASGLCLCWYSGKPKTVRCTSNNMWQEKVQRARPEKLRQAKAEIMREEIATLQQRLQDLEASSSCSYDESEDAFSEPSIVDGDNGTPLRNR